MDDKKTAGDSVATKEAPPQGHIDRYEGGIVYGWAYDPAKPDTSLKVQILDRGGALGEGVANILREDLKKAGMGNGKHAFAIKVRPPADQAEQVELMLAEPSTGKTLLLAPFITANPAKVRFQFRDVQWGHLDGEISGDLLEGDVLPFQLLAENGDSLGGYAGIRVAPGRYAFNIPLPRLICDGNLHAITLALTGSYRGEATYVDVIPSLYTPWEYLVSSAKELTYSSLSRTAGYRYDSLQRQIQALQQGGDAAHLLAEMSNLTTAHRVVVEGYQGRKQYPRLRLPKVDKPDVSIVIPVHNKLELTYHCLASLILAANKASFEVIVVDDCSTDRTQELPDLVENLRVIVNETNLGFLRNCNKAAQQAKGSYLVMLNNDTEVTSGWLDELVETFERFDGVGMAGSKLIYPDGKLQEAGGIVWGNGQPWNLGNRDNPQAPEWNYARQADYLSGAAIMLSRKVWDEVGGFSDEFAPAYYEDTDLAFKVRAQGYKTVYAPYSVVVHFEGMSNGRDETQGVKKNQAINAPKFRAKWIDSYLNNGQPSRENVVLHKDRGVVHRVLMIDHAVPCPDQDAGSYAAVQEMRMLQANGCKVSFLAENMAHMGRYTDALQKMGVECFYAPFQTSINQVLEQRGREFDLVYITRYSVAEKHLPAVRQHTRAKVLLNNADLHFLRELRAALAAKHTDLSGPLATRDRELALMRQVDGILCYNPTEQAVIVSHNLRSDNLYHCPWVLDGRGHKTPFKARKGLAFLGGYRHPPNVEAVVFFVEQVMPLLRKRLPGVAFHVYGSHMPESFKKYEAEDVILEGFVETLDSVFESARLMVAPLLSGAGIKGKVLEGMSAGVPQVLSPVAAEATGLTHGVTAMIVQEPQSWADTIVKLYENEKLWQQISSNSMILARGNYSFDAGIKAMSKVLEGVGVYAPKYKHSLIGRP